jgi:hypothetical protein
MHELSKSLSQGGLRWPEMIQLLFIMIGQMGPCYNKKVICAWWGNLSFWGSAVPFLRYKFHVKDICDQSYLSWIAWCLQSYCKKRMAQCKVHKYKMEARMPSFYPAVSYFMGPSKESTLFNKSSF